MSFKHNKFDSYDWLRSYERVAIAKGLVKPEMKKEAKNSLDLTPSEDLMENILKLCNGLKSKGMDKYAEELSKSFLQYKSATLYDAGGEKLIHDAHPEGSPKLQGVESSKDYAVIENILSEHMKLLDIVNKKPTGKLASSKDIIKAVKKALGQTAEDNTVKLGNIIENTIKMWNDLHEIVREKANLSYFGAKTNFGDLSSEIRSLLSNGSNIDANQLTKSIRIVKKLEKMLQPDTFLGIDMGADPEAWSRISIMFARINENLHKALKIRNELNQSETEQKYPNFKKEDESSSTPVNDEVVQKFQDLLVLVQNYIYKANYSNLPNSPALISWLQDKAIPTINQRMKDYSEPKIKPVSDEQKAHHKQLFLDESEKIKATLNDFNNTYLVKHE